VEYAGRYGRARIGVWRTTHNVDVHARRGTMIPHDTKNTIIKSNTILAQTTPLHSRRLSAHTRHHTLYLTLSVSTTTLHDDTGSLTSEADTHKRPVSCASCFRTKCLPCLASPYLTTMPYTTLPCITLPLPYQTSVRSPKHGSAETRTSLEMHSHQLSNHHPLAVL